MPLMDNFDIIIEIQEPTPRQLAHQGFMIDHRMLVKESLNYRDALLRILRDRIDFSTYPDKEVLVIKYKRTGSHKFDYSSLKSKKAKAQIRRVLEDSHPIVC
jgi:hypothetical protein